LCLFTAIIAGLYLNYLYNMEQARIAAAAAAAAAERNRIAAEKRRNSLCGLFDTALSLIQTVAPAAELAYTATTGNNLSPALKQVINTVANGPTHRPFEDPEFLAPGQANKVRYNYENPNDD
jgi:hypothetical protein